MNSCSEPVESVADNNSAVLNAAGLGTFLTNSYQPAPRLLPGGQARHEVLQQ